ncbi:MAG TPA: hypothetical protein VFW31_09385 [Candidatus Angelobacter sp.]|nr:hypothetical protein [Candidatus Angelobacter sp.]
MDSNNPSKPAIRFGGFVWLWNVPRRSGESTRQRFFSIYEDLRQALQQHSSGSNIPERKWNMVRISLPGKKFLGLVRR